MSSLPILWFLVWRMMFSSKGSMLPITSWIFFLYFSNCFCFVMKSIDLFLLPFLLSFSVSEVPGKLSQSAKSRLIRFLAYLFLTSSGLNGFFGSPSKPLMDWRDGKFLFPSVWKLYSSSPGLFNSSVSSYFGSGEVSSPISLATGLVLILLLFVSAFFFYALPFNAPPPPFDIVPTGLGYP